MKKIIALLMTVLLAGSAYALDKSAYCRYAMSSAGTASELFHRALEEKKAENWQYYMEQGIESLDTATSYAHTSGCATAAQALEDALGYAKSSYTAATPRDGEFYLKMAIDELDKAQNYINECLMQ